MATADLAEANANHNQRGRASYTRTQQMETTHPQALLVIVLALILAALLNP
jgi:hypothetical protein